VGALALPTFGLEPARQPGALVGGEPLGVGRSVGEIEIGDEREDDRRQRLDDE